MVGLIVELILSWLLLWYFDRSHLAVLGIRPTQTRLLTFLTGLLLAASVCTAYNLLTTAFVDNGWTLRKPFRMTQTLQGLWWVLRSVLFEEFIFRGALLYLLIKRIGITKACFLSAACFGVYHWFTYGAFGNPVTMIFIFFVTGIAGFMFAYAFAKTGSLYLPIALHFGWNAVHTIVFSNGPLGPQIFQKMNTNQVQGLSSWLVFLFQTLVLPLLTLFYIRWWAKGQFLSSVKKQNVETGV